MKYQRISILIFLLSISSLFAAGKVNKRDRFPNVVIMLTDDQGWGDLSVSGNRDISTPNIDSLAKEGASFDHFYVCPVCSPTRAEMLTGRYYTRTGVTKTSSGGERLNLDEYTMAEAFKSASYATGAFGKWHNGSQWPYHPNARGFDEFYGFTSGHWGYYFSPELEHNGELVQGNGYIADDFTDRAMQFIEKNKDKPFLCYIPYCTPHSPMQITDEYWNRFKDKNLSMLHRDPKIQDIEHTRAALAMCENIDYNVGRVLDKLDELQLSENTIVIFFTDNGPNGWRWNNGMKGKKGSVDEGGVRSPFFIRWPGKIREGLSIAEIAGAIDILPTLSELCGFSLEGDKKLDGVSLRPLLEETVSSWPERLIFTYWMERASVRSQDYRLDKEGRLFNIINDPGQRDDLAAKKPDLAKSMSKALTDWIGQTVEPFVQRPFTVGHPGAIITNLPARDGISHGSIKRSSPHPNDSFFYNWTNAADKITWGIEVLTAAKYEAIIRYTCTTENVGAVMELEFSDQKIRRKVTEAFDPPLRGERENKTYNKESFVKDWKSLSLGEIYLPAKKADITLRAIDIPGAEAIDLRYLILKRLK